MIGYTLSKVLGTRLISAIASRFITPKDAASVISRHGAEARKLTQRQKYEAVHAELRAYVAAKAGRAA